MLDVLHRPVHFGVSVTTAPTLSPFTLEHAKDWLHVSDAEEDDLLAAIVQSAIETVENDTGLLLRQQTVTLSLDTVPGDQVIEIPFAPIQSVTSVTSYNAAGTSAVVATSVYRVDTISTPPRLVLKDGQAWPSDLRPQNALEIVIVAGYADAEDIPATLLQAVRYLMGHAFSMRTPVVVGSIAGPVDLTYTWLIGPHRLRVVM